MDGQNFLTATVLDGYFRNWQKVSVDLSTNPPTARWIRIETTHGDSWVAFHEISVFEPGVQSPFATLFSTRASGDCGGATSNFWVRITGSPNHLYVLGASASAFRCEPYSFPPFLGNLYLRPENSVTVSGFLDSQGHALFQWPASVVPPGLTIYFQAFVQDLVSGAGGFTNLHNLQF
jgi:hypothetical protein